MRSFAEKPMVRNGRLTQVGLCFRAGNNVKRSAVFECSCSGMRIIATVANVKSGRVRSCGCLGAESRSKNTRTHGKARSKIYGIYCAMVRRCSNPNSKEFPNYGGRGIRVFQRWKSFEAFILDMGEPENGATLDRIDVNGNYSKENCRWTSWTTQQRNRRNNRMLSFNGETMCSAEWADKTGLSQSAINLRLKRGWSVEKTLSEPLKSKHLERSR